MCRRIIVKLYNNQSKSENQGIFHDIKISYVEVVKKNENVSHKLSYTLLTRTKNLRRSFIELKKDCFRFRVKVTIKLLFDIKTFC